MPPRMNVLAICDIDLCSIESLSFLIACVLSSDEGKIIHKTLINSGTKTNFPLSPSVSFSTFLFPYALVNLSVNANFGPTRFPFREPSRFFLSIFLMLTPTCSHEFVGGPTSNSNLHRKIKLGIVPGGEFDRNSIFLSEALSLALLMCCLHFPTLYFA